MGPATRSDNEAESAEILLAVDRLTIETRPQSNPGEVSLREVSFTLPCGDFLVLAGEHGSGVSMFCQWLAGGAVGRGRVLSGDVLHEGVSLVGTGRRQQRELSRSRFLYAGRDFLATFVQNRSVLQNLSDFVRGRSLPGAVLERSVLQEKLYRVGCLEPERLLQQKVGELAPVDLARLLLLRVLLAGADLFLCDGVTESMDSVTRCRFLEMLIHIQKEETLSLIYTSGSLRGVDRFADGLVVFYEGAVLEKGGAAELIANPRYLYTREFLASTPSVGPLSAGPGGISREAVAEAEEAVRGTFSTWEAGGKRGWK